MTKLEARIICHVIRGLRSMDEVDKMLAWVYGLLTLGLAICTYFLSRTATNAVAPCVVGTLLVFSLLLNRLGIWGI